jgi:hypothetical protein
MPAFVWQVKPDAGEFLGVSTYRGDMNNPCAYPAEDGPASMMVMAGKPRELADTLYQLTAAEYNGADIRVSAVAGVRGDDHVTWKIAHVNRHGDQG